MRFVVYGAGAVGGSLGALLFQAGLDVTLIARGAHLEAIRSSGLRFRHGNSERTLPIPAVAAPSQIDWRPGDIVLLGMKSQDTAPALRELSAAADPAVPGPAVVCVQNGVANERTALRFFSEVYGVCVMFPAVHLEPGVVQAKCHPVPAILDIGRFPTGVDDRAREVAKAFESAGCHSEPRPNIMAWKYTKLLMNLGNTPQALFGLGDGARSIARLAREEGRAALRAAGIDFVTEEEDAERRGDILRSDPADPPNGGSTWQSLVRGTGSIETDYLAGEIALLGRLHGVPTPVNALAQRLGNVFAREGRKPGSITPEEFTAMLGSSS